MSILDKLIEKKDLKVYCQLRIRRFKESLERIKDYPEPRRELLRQRYLGRIRELEHLQGRLGDPKQLKIDCKNLWRHFDLRKKEKELETNLDKEWDEFVKWVVLLKKDDIVGKVKTDE